MEDNLQENKFIVIMKRIWPTVVRILNIIFYNTFMFIKNAISYIIEQISSY